MATLREARRRLLPRDRAGLEKDENKKEIPGKTGKRDGKRGSEGRVAPTEGRPPPKSRERDVSRERGGVPFSLSPQGLHRHGGAEMRRDPPFKGETRKKIRRRGERC
ncbi:hypothetical protein AKJ37_05300 [candidate division MSBL1 archaeon SCGC-AAA259I09]|uniref:Uncharacterized protein n=1 Tax=candidate division MSBL1 archaeon SCGC-AAA259I09 TaxID=1698267 RepID=A0A133UQH0_9EURY|nr:hypothetical protein AKJ37_05300 [candidate division MSBL1 archaeon SCGC-AAA259I09]